MKYNFDELIERRGTNCVKWDERPRVGEQSSGISPSPEVIPLWVADMDFRVAPAIQKALQQRVEHGVFGYNIVPESYYEAVISWFHRRHQWDIQRSWILYTTAVVPAMSCVIKALTMPGEKVLILSPAYNCFFSSIKNNGCEVLESPLKAVGDTFEVDFDDFEAKCADEKTTLFLLCNPHNPSGRVWTREELQRMYDICQQHGVKVVSDEIHCELVMPGHQFVPFGTITDDGVVMNSPSKNELNQYLWGNYQLLRDFIAENLPQWKVCRLEGTYLPWVDISAMGITSQELCDRLLAEAKVWINPGTMYGPQTGEGYVRFNIAIQRSRLLDALQRIKAYLG